MISDLTTTLARIEALAEAATPGPWHFNDTTDHRGHKGEFRAPSPHNGIMLVGPWVNDADPALIVEAVNATPRLVAALRAVEALVENEALHGPFIDPDDEDMDVAFKDGRTSMARNICAALAALTEGEERG